MIALRIFHVSRAAVKVLGNNVSRTYKTVIAIILESGIIYPLCLSILGGFTAPTRNASSVASLLLKTCWIPLAGIAPTLIVIRIALEVTHDTVEATLTTFRAASRHGAGPVIDVRQYSRYRGSSMLSERSDEGPPLPSDLEAPQVQ
ncbi:hypothetical protein VNI00_010818 [Paramarasmius palmivorus]|uniref:Uncharacterized protein n=1 Tax=Paramarasmius palmivorus TaxID=297713 RepID=A0AAW0CDA7_9AGAR